MAIDTEKSNEQQQQQQNTGSSYCCDQHAYSIPFGKFKYFIVLYMPPFMWS